MEFLNLSFDAWQIICGLVLLVSWFVRLESRTKNLEIRLGEQIIKHDALDSKVIDQLSKIRESLARIEGRLDAKTSKQRSIKNA